MMGKRICAILLTVIIMCSCFISYGAAAHYDVNGDGYIDLKDVLYLRKCLAKIAGFTTSTACDLNGDKGVDMKDVLFLRLYLIKDPSVTYLDGYNITYQPAREELPEVLKQAYDIMLKDINASKYQPETIKIGEKTCVGHVVDFESTSVYQKLTVDDFVVAYKALLADHPELFFLSSGYTYRYREFTEGKMIIEAGIEYCIDQNKIYDAEVKLANSVGNIMKNVPESSDYDVEKYFHDTICNICQYDYETAQKTAKQSDLSYTVYGALVEGKAVCTGYASSMQLLCDLQGIQCFRVCGNTETGNHEWNVIYLEGMPYYLDATWDDSDEYGVMYTYFNVNDTLLKTRTLQENSITIPTCTATKYDYYIYNNLYASSGAVSKATTLIANCIKDGTKKASIKTTASEYSKLIAWIQSGDLFEDVNNKLGFYGLSSYGYIRNDQMYIIQFNIY